MVLRARRHRVARALPPAVALAAVWWLSTTAGPFSATDVNDLYVYSVIAEAIRDGQVPYRDFAFEYPPLAAVPIAALGGSATGWSLAMLACALGAQAASRALGGARAAWAMVALAPVAGALVRTHFDLLPAALALGGLLAVVRGRPALGLAVLGAGTLTKLWPALVALVVLAWLAGRGDTRGAGRGLAAFAVVVAAGALPFAVAGGFPRELVAFHLERPVQIESAPASVLFALGDSYVTGHPVRPDRFKSNGLDGGADAEVTLLFTALQLLALAAVVALAARRPAPRDLVLASFAAVLAFVVLGKVLSPQFVCWLLPPAAVMWALGARVPAALTAAAALLTQAWFPARYFDLVARDDAVVAAVAVRNALLLLALGATAAALARSRPRASAASSGSPPP